MDIDREHEEAEHVEEIEEVNAVESMDTTPDSAAAHGPAPLADQPNDRADDVEHMKKKIFPPQADLELAQEFNFTWEIEDWKQFSSNRVRSPEFNAEGFSWRILLFPKGNREEYASVSAFVEVTPEGVDPENPPNPDEQDWHSCAQFGLVLWNPKDPSVYHSQYASHRFNPDERDWGFNRFYDLGNLFNKHPGRDVPITADGAVNVSAYVKIFKDPTGVLWHNFLKYDSKKETGYVGLKNQGATCYLNSLLQSLFLTRQFRDLVYRIPTDDASSSTVSASLQRIFYLLQSSDQPVGTMELTRSFGWDTGDAFTQHDVQELERVLMDKLESQMKGTDVEGRLNDLFVAQMKSYIKCVNVDFESSRTEDFWDLQLNVRGMKNLETSFKNYIETEMLDGENKYDATGFGLQDAKKGVVFQSFPPVLHLQLKRYDYDFIRDTMIKINDRYEFPLDVDLAPYLEEGSDMSESWNYSLHGVLVHAGDQNAGHYYALIKPDVDSDWYKFDDDRVTRATLKEVMEENFGTDEPPMTNTGPMRFNRLNIRRHSSAYMLVYIRTSRAQQLLGGPEPTVPEQIPARIEREREEELSRRREREEQQYFCTIKLLSNNEFQHYQGFDMGQWSENRQRDGEQWVAEAQTKQVKIRKKSKLSEVYQVAAEQVGLDVDKIRLWALGNRQNKTYRLDHPIDCSETLTLERSVPRLLTYGPSHVDFWVESVETDENGEKILSTDDSRSSNPVKGSSLIFIKEFDRALQVIRGFGSHTMNNTDTMGDLAQWIKEQQGIPQHVELKLYEEIKPEMIEDINLKSNLIDSELSDGDIVCFEKVLPLAEGDRQDVEPLANPRELNTAREYYDYMNNRVKITFKKRPLDDGEESDFETPGEFDLWLHKLNSSEDMTNIVGKVLNVPPSHLQFFITDATGTAKRSIKNSPNTTVRSFTQSTYANGTYWIMYSVLNMSLDELESKQQVQLYYLTDGLSQEHKVDILVPPGAHISDAIALLQQKCNIKQELIPKLKVWTASNHRYNKQLSADTLVAQINTLSQIYVTAQSDEEEDLAEFGPEDDMKLIIVQHFHSDPAHTHSVPFTFVLIKDEPFSRTKARLQRALGLFDKVFENIKFAILAKKGLQDPIYVDSDTYVPDCDEDYGAPEKEGEFELFDVFSPEDHVLGLDHYDKSSRRGPGHQGAIKMR